MIDSFRIIKTEFVSSAFSGEGARLYGGRWNSPGTSMVYLAGSLAAAILEILVHTEDFSTIKDLYSYIPVRFSSKYLKTLQINRLPPDWNASTPIAATQVIGDSWIASASSVTLKVPSAVVEGEFNYLLNPKHSDFVKLVQGEPRKLKLDPRLNSERD